jgi:hypothetical protein
LQNGGGAVYNVVTLPALAVTKFSAKIKGAAEIPYNFKVDIFVGDILMQTKQTYYDPPPIASIDLDTSVAALTTQYILPTYSGITASISLDVTVI